MKGDFSRLTDRTSSHYEAVLSQQGRVWLDSDWNEAVLERVHLLEDETVDIVGACGVPAPHTAFAVSANPDPNGDPTDFRISGGPGPAGRFYVEGLLARLDQPVSYRSQPDFPDPPAIVLPQDGSPLTAVVYLEVWRRLITYLEDDAVREVALCGPDTGTRLRTVAQVKVAPAPEDVTCATAADSLPATGHGTLTTIQPRDELPDDLCRIPDPATYTGRENRLYRVEVHDAGDVAGATTGAAFEVKLGADAATGDNTLKLAAALGQGQLDALGRSGLLTVAQDDGQSELARVATAAADSITLQAGLAHAYTTAQNATVVGGVARFKWSRDNASFGVRVTDVSADRHTLTLAALGRDQATALRQGDIVEIEDDASDLGPAVGHLTILSADPDPDGPSVALADALPDTFRTDRHLKLRRWDGTGWARASFDPVKTPDMNLGDGVHIQFGGAGLLPGDYWQFVARSTDGSVEALADAPPAGIVRHRCPLAVVRWTRQPAGEGEPVVDPAGLAALAEEVGVRPRTLARFQSALDEQAPATVTAAAAFDLARSVRVPQEQAAQLGQAVTEKGEVQQVVAFDLVEDCREPFDPLTSRHDCACDCTVAVAPGESIPAAIDKVGDEGGVVCILPGLHHIDQTVVVRQRSNLTIRGAGPASVLLGPSLPVVLRFEGCQGLTLRDLAVWGGPPDPERAPAGDAKPVSLAALGDDFVNPLQIPGEYLGAVTLLGCAEVALIACRVTCANLPEQAAARACVSFLGSVGEHAGPNVTVAALAEAAVLRRPYDLTVRGCRLYADVMAGGLLVSACVGVTVEDTWLLALAGTGAVPGVAPPEQRALFAVALAQCLLIRLAGNVAIGLAVVVLANASELSLEGNIGAVCGAGMVAPSGAGVLAMTDNLFLVDAGPAVHASGSGELALVGNRLSAAAGSVGPFATEDPVLGNLQAAVVHLSGDRVTVTDNGFQANQALAVAGVGLPLAVLAQGRNVIYTGNRSVCGALPSLTNVLLFAGPLEDTVGSVTAVSNTCIEPAVAPITDLTGKAKEIKKNQDDLAGNLVSGKIPVDVFVREAGSIDQQWANFQQQVDKQGADLFRQRISLLAMAGAAVTGANLLTYALVRVGRGSDTGSVSAVT